MIWLLMRPSRMLLLSSLPSCRLMCPESGRFSKELRVEQRRNSSALSLKWRQRVRTCRQQSLMYPRCRLSCSVLPLVELSQKELAVHKVLEWFPGIFRVQVSFPLNKVLLTFLSQDLFDFELLLFFRLVMKCFLQGCALVGWFNH